MENEFDASLLSFNELKAKQRKIREAFPSDLGVRIHRALSWLHRAEQSDDDDDAAFIFYWIAFNAAYAHEEITYAPIGERSSFDEYFGKLISLDAEQIIYDAIWRRYSGPIRLLLDNRYVFQPFWKHHNDVKGGHDWEAQFARSKRLIKKSLQNSDTKSVLCTLFDRLYVLRNQLVHGGATWNSSVNRDQVRDGSRILGFLVPLFIDLMMENPDLSWGTPYYPVVD
jgi:hypothetical protein